MGGLSVKKEEEMSLKKQQFTTIRFIRGVCENTNLQP